MESLYPPKTPDPVWPDVPRAAAAGGNVRETLFALDDVYQSRRK
jgi:hypothetical protein